MIKFYTFKQTAWCVLFFSLFQMQGATKTVFNLLDNGSPGSLREVIANSNAGDTIVFGVSGTILLDSTKGSLVVDKKLIIDGENKIIIDGNNQIVTGMLITSVDASETLLTNFTLTQFKGVLSTDVAHGLLIENGAADCSIIGCTIEKISADGESGLAIAIEGTEDMQEISDTTMQDITAEGADSREGTDVFLHAVRMPLDKTLQLFTHNIVTRIHNNAPYITFSVYAVWASITTCTHNIISDIRSDLPKALTVALFGLNLLGSAQAVSYNTITDIMIKTDSPGVGTAAIILPQEAGQITNNTISNFYVSSPLNEAMYGILQNIGSNVQTVAYNTVSNIVSIRNTSLEILCFNKQKSHKACNLSFADNTAGFFFNGTVQGNVVHNTVYNVQSSASNTFNIFGMYFCQIDGVCANNIIENVISNNIDAQLVGGLYISGEQENLLTLTNNTIKNVKGINPTFGIFVKVDSAYLCGNTVKTISSDDTAYGILFDVAEQVTAERNTIADITAENNDGYGITFESIPPLGIKLLSNSIFDITTKTFNFTLTQGHDAQVALNEVRCVDGCKLIIDGQLIPTQVLPTETQYLIQFFASDSNMPEQLQTAIGEYTHDPLTQGVSFAARFTVPVSIRCDQFITATATALIDPNVSTSDVSNAVPGCATRAIFCSVLAKASSNKLSLSTTLACSNVFPCNEIL